MEDLVVLFSINPTQVMRATNYPRVAAKVILRVQSLSLGTRYHFKIVGCHIKLIRVSTRTLLEMTVPKQDLFKERVVRCQMRRFRLNKLINLASDNPRWNI